MPEQLPTQLEAAIHYAARGFEVFPANANTKAPLTPNGMKDATCDETQIRKWWTEHPDALVACRIPDDQVVLDIDPRHGGDTTWRELQNAYATILSARTHTSGRGDGGAHHWFKRPAGKLSARKLHDWARNNGVGQRVAETKWTSGIDILHHNHRYSILPPSLHPATGKPYLWTHRDEPAEMPAFLADLITADEPAPVPQPTTVVNSAESIADWFSRTATWNSILEPVGWTVAHGDGNSDGSKWKHPNASAASSASIKHGNLFVYSPNTHFDETEDGDPHGYTRFRAWATINYGADLSTAARAAIELRDGPRPPDVALADLIAAPPSLPPAGVNLPDEFWDTRPVLQHIRQAAHSRLVSADAVLLAVLARVVMLTPPTIALPAIVGSRVSLNLFVAVIDSSGGGKSAAVAVARELLPHDRRDIADPILPSSGEGLIEAFMGSVDVVDDDGKTKKERQQVNTAGLAWVDEGQGLLAQGERSGSTIMETIRSAWMGGDLGQHNATEERKRWLKAHRYRLSMIVGFQLVYAASLIADGEGGTPQRFTFASAGDPSIDATAEWPGELDWQPHPTIASGVDMTFDPCLAAGIRERRLQRSRGELAVDPLDTHADLRKMKLAGALALLEGRTHVTTDDWMLAEQIDRTSCAVRSLAIEHDRSVKARAEQAYSSRLAERAAVIETSAEQRALASGSKSIARRVHKVGGTSSRSIVVAAVAGKHKKIVTVDDMLAEAERLHWIVADGDGWKPGEARPL